MRRIALTGGIATGKTYVRGRFEDLGLPTIDADALARDAVAPGSPGLASVAARFGPQVLDGAGALDRQKLAAIVFADPGARRDLETIVHPRVRQTTAAWFLDLERRGVACALADIPLLYEVHRERDFDAVVVVACSPETQLRRLMSRDGLSEEEARLRIRAQLPIGEKVRRADHVINTEGSFAETDAQVQRIHRTLTDG